MVKQEQDVKFAKEHLRHLRQALVRNSKRLGLVSLKTGTEAENMGFSEILFFRNLSQGILPLSVKIGGPEARIDIRTLLLMQVNGIIAPLIESPYALEKFIQTRREIENELNELKELSERSEQQEGKKRQGAVNEFCDIWNGINIESKNGLAFLSDICQTSEFKDISQITAARTDLSQSLHLDCDHPQVMQFCKQILTAAKKYGKRTIIGGGIQADTCFSLVSQLQPDCVSTRNLVLDATYLRESERICKERILKSLEFEIEIYQTMSAIFTDHKSTYESRILTLQKRMR